MGFATQFGCVPLAERWIRLPNSREAVLAAGVMTAAVGAAAFGLAPAAIAFTTAVLAAIVLGLMPAQQVYAAIDWPVIVLLGALIPVAGAIESTGAADLMARVLIEDLAGGNAVIGLVAVLVITMMLSDFMNNAATRTTPLS